MDPLKIYIQSVYHVSEHDWNLIKDFFQPAEVKAGEYFVHTGKICHRMGFVARGVLRYTYFKENGKEITCNFVSEGEFIGESNSFFQRSPADVNVQAITDCEVFTFTLHDFKKMVAIYSRFVEISGDIAQKTIRSLLDKRNFLVDSDARTKYQYFLKHYPHIMQRVPLGYVASYLDITQQSLSRLRKHIS